MKKINLVAAIALAIAATSSQAIVLNFGNTTTAGIQGADFNYAVCNEIDFTASTELRLCSPTNTDLIGGRSSDAINGTESWEFNNSGVMTAVNNTATTDGIYQYADSSADSEGGLALDKGFPLRGNTWGFLAPILGSNAGDAYGEGVYTETSEISFEIFFPVIEAQWAGLPFTMGSDDADGDGVGDGVTFYGATDGSNFSMWAEHTIAASEELPGAGFSGWTAQWYYVGTIDDIVIDPSPVPVPAAVWLFGSGILGLAGVARRRKML